MDPEYILCYFVLNTSYGHELVNWEMSVYFDNIGLVLQRIEKLVLRLCGVKNRMPKPKRNRLQKCLHFSKTRAFRTFMV